jgi:hypothetical protein
MKAKKFLMLASLVIFTVIAASIGLTLEVHACSYPDACLIIAIERSDGSLDCISTCSIQNSDGSMSAYNDYIEYCESSEPAATRKCVAFYYPLDRIDYSQKRAKILFIYDVIICEYSSRSMIVSASGRQYTVLLPDAFKSASVSMPAVVGMESAMSRNKCAALNRKPRYLLLHEDVEK